MMFMREKEFDMRNSLSNSLVIMFQTMAINFRWMSKILIQKTLLIIRMDPIYANLSFLVHQNLHIRVCIHHNLHSRVFKRQGFVVRRHRTSMCIVQGCQGTLHKRMTNQTPTRDIFLIVRTKNVRIVCRTKKVS